MTVVLVHGNPETPAIWDLLAESLMALGVDEPVRLAPPGFGAPVPDGWGATVMDYRDWLIGELERLRDEGEGPVDLVGHDWGGGHVLNAVMARPDLVRTWCCDVVGLFDPDYTWHDAAQIWQRPGDGEGWVAEWLDSGPQGRAGLLAALGMNPVAAAPVAAGANPTMGECILRLYRSAAQPVMAELGVHLEAAAARPGLAVMADGDAWVGTHEQQQRAAARAGARVATLDGLGHWWMTHDPEQGARMLVEFWQTAYAQQR